MAHLYDPNRASFDILVESLRPGGLYVIEDWAWAYQPETMARFARYQNEKPLACLINELTKSVGTPVSIIKNITIYPHVAVLDRADTGKSKGPNLSYRELRRRVKTLIKNLPARAIAAVVSKGDEELIRLNGQKGWHFPQSEDGRYAGSYSTDTRKPSLSWKVFVPRVQNIWLSPEPHSGGWSITQISRASQLVLSAGLER
ncbi:MAG: hypothetical protein ACT4OT_11405 [Acidobacteriota bacterium]